MRAIALATREKRKIGAEEDCVERYVASIVHSRPAFARVPAEDASACRKNPNYSDRHSLKYSCPESIPSGCIASSYNERSPS
jgi:hypothetical protein